MADESYEVELVYFIGRRGGNHSATLVREHQRMSVVYWCIGTGSVPKRTRLGTLGRDIKSEEHAIKECELIAFEHCESPIKSVHLRRAHRDIQGGSNVR